MLAVVLLPGRRREHADRRPITSGSGPDSAFLGFLQLTAAVLNLLPIPGLDGYGIIEPYLDPQTRQFGGQDQAVGHARA